MKAIVTVGISASGKTSWAEDFVKRNLGWANINRDDTRFRLFNNGIRDWSKYKFSRKNEMEVSEDIERQIAKAADLAINLVISDTNLNPTFREKLCENLESYGYEVVLKDFPVSFEEAVKRDNARSGGVGHNIIYTQYQSWLTYIERKRYIPDPTKPSAILVDIDGTVAKMHNRGPFQWDRVGEDLPNENVIKLVKSFTKDEDCTVVFMSGRDESCKVLTKEWLVDNGFDQGFRLLMRPEGSYEKDTKVKEDLFWDHVAENYYIKFAIDDRPCIIRLWRELGIETFCVSDPYIEF